MKNLAAIVILALVGFAFIPEQNIEIPDINSKIDKTEGINFDVISLEDAKKLAKESGKIIFIDAYTSWCGPCKRMAATSFMDKKVGELYNGKFINLKIDCEKDPDGPEIARRYRISAYPTLLYIDSEGKLIKSVIGFQDAGRLISLGEAI